MNVRSIGIATSIVVSALVVACGGSERRSGFDTETNPTDPAADGGSNVFEPGADVKSTGCTVNDTSKDLELDSDGDGYALKDDCNECNPSINKGAIDIPGNGVDDDCNGTVDDEPVDCDGNIDVDTNDAFEGAKAIGLCKKATKDGRDWGVVEATWVKPDGSKLSKRIGVGVVDSLGVNAPQNGASMLVLSSGAARSPDDSEYDSTVDKNYTSGTPDGYPKESPACPGVETGEAHDGAGLLVKLRVPSNAKSFSYQQFFFTAEYPGFICKSFNDFFVTVVEPTPEGLPDGNIAFDQDTNPISVNNSFLQVCEAGSHGGKEFACPLGPDLLDGTGFDDGGGTGWLTTTAPVVPGSEISILFTIWDSGDGIYDSTVLIDDFKFSTEEAGTTQTRPSGPK